MHTGRVNPQFLFSQRVASRILPELMKRSEAEKSRSCTLLCFVHFYDYLPVIVCVVLCLLYLFWRQLDSKALNAGRQMDEGWTDRQCSHRRTDGLMRQTVRRTDRRTDRWADRPDRQMVVVFYADQVYGVEIKRYPTDSTYRINTVNTKATAKTATTSST